MPIGHRGNIKLKMYVVVCSSVLVLVLNALLRTTAVRVSNFHAAFAIATLILFEQIVLEKNSHRRYFVPIVISGRQH